MEKLLQISEFNGCKHYKLVRHFTEADFEIDFESNLDQAKRSGNESDYLYCTSFVSLKQSIIDQLLSEMGVEYDKNGQYLDARSPLGEVTHSDYKKAVTLEKVDSRRATYGRLRTEESKDEKFFEVLGEFASKVNNSFKENSVAMSICELNSEIQDQLKVKNRDFQRQLKSAYVDLNVDEKNVSLLAEKIDADYSQYVNRLNEINQLINEYMDKRKELMDKIYSVKRNAVEVELRKLNNEAINIEIDKLNKEFPENPQVEVSIFE